jgi:hypothetical protein
VLIRLHSETAFKSVLSDRTKEHVRTLVTQVMLFLKIASDTAKRGACPKGQTGDKQLASSRKRVKMRLGVPV